MAETLVDASAQADPSQQLLATKLYLPSPTAGFVPRPRLAEQLERGLTRKLTLVCAPAGFGKTSVLADWIQRPAHDVAWLSLDASDNDAVRFWRYAVAALDRVRPGIATELAPSLGSRPSGSFDALVGQVINALAREPGGIVLVLDDYHVIDAAPVHDSLAFLLDHAPDALHVVLAARADPPLPLARLRARGQLAELRAADLRFSPDEAGVLLREAVGSALDDDAVARLAARTEGWAAGLQLAAVSLQEQADVAGFVESFSGSHRYVLDYLTEEVLERQTEDVRTFLLETSVLERLSGPLCDAVTGRADSQALLEFIERANLFLVPLDEVRAWWRNHQLFADLLRVRLQREQPERAVELHLNAARWYEQHGLVDDAVRHAALAGDTVGAARLMERYADAQLVQGEEMTLQRWIGSLPPELLASRPRLLLAKTRFVMLDEIEDLLDMAERAYADSGDEPYEPTVGRGKSRLANVPGMIAVVRAFAAFQRGDGPTTQSYAAAALAALDDDEWFLASLATATKGAAEWLCGVLDEAERAIASTIAQWRARGVHEMIALWCQYLGLVQLGLGRLDRAEETFRQIVADRTAGGQATSLAAGSAYIGLATIAYQRDELDAAEEYVNEGLALSREFVSPDALALGLARLAWIHYARGDTAGAATLMAEATKTADPSVVDLLSPVPAQHAFLQLVQGNVDAASRWTEARGVSCTDEPRHACEPAYLVLARVLTAQGDTECARGLLDRLLESATAQRRTGSIIEIQVAQTLARSAAGDESGALDALSAALALGQGQGYVHVFVSNGPPLASLFGALLASQRDELRDGTLRLDYVASVARAFERQGGASPVAASSASFVPSLVTQLSEREVEVLRLLAAGEQNQQIADELYLALNTVKKHITHIFEKLGVANRTEAAARARELGVLS